MNLDLPSEIKPERQLFWRGISRQLYSDSSGTIQLTPLTPLTKEALAEATWRLSGQSVIGIDTVLELGVLPVALVAKHLTSGQVARRGSGHADLSA
ncbi:hypothetical protein [Bradyrhizobium australafricanum]|uniref:hypothetical protein n=1 Tax=Bradyrhizobium australafricanum TaxID=2821406 RepID=UPI001CE2FF4E|nr:hypothetical protein [Bradyrhizobium australafricanum]MCA6100535.1 hypothetical protein [Bradyrhizobium australafricanum]